MIKRYVFAFLLTIVICSTFVISFTSATGILYAQGQTSESFTPKRPILYEEPQTIDASFIIDFSLASDEDLEKLILEQKLSGIWPFNPIKYAIQTATITGVPANTIVLLLLLPLVVAVIAAARHVIGLRGFGIFLPAALAVVFLATGPLVGIGLFALIVTTSTLVRYFLRKTNIKLQYLPRTALVLLFVVFTVMSFMFIMPILNRPEIASVSIFPILILVLLAEDFTKVQAGKSARLAINITTETLILALISYIFLTLPALRRFAILNPEVLLISVIVFDFIVGKYVGLRFVEYWRFRKLLRK